MGTPYDIAVIGGGINGAGIAADAAGRGLKTILFERGDLGCGTSSASSKLIHGGLRYLENFEFGLVHDALVEREVLMARAPHLIQPLRFVIPYADGMRSKFLLRCGLWIYDHLAARKHIPGSRAINLQSDPAGRPLRDAYRDGFSYYDCQVDDARLVVLVALDAAQRGADIHTCTPVTALARRGSVWTVSGDSPRGPITIEARVVVNAAGPWCSEVAALASDADSAPLLRLVRGVHIVVPRVEGADSAYLLQNNDGRIVFVMPFEKHHTLIGTTEAAVSTPGEGFLRSLDEERYLLAAVSRFFAQAPLREDIVWTYAGVRPLMEDGAKNSGAVSRDYRLDLVPSEGGAPFLLNVVGGKITTYRRLAESALDRLGPLFPTMGRRWTAKSPLPGGEAGIEGLPGYLADLGKRKPGIDTAALARLVRLYGSRADLVLGDATSDDDLGAFIGGGLTEREVMYLEEHEWATTADDVLWRRTKAGLGMPMAQRQAAELHINRLLARDRVKQSP